MIIRGALNPSDKNYSFLVHTSGKKADHKSDWSTIQSTLTALTDSTSSKFQKYTKDIWSIAQKKYADADPNSLVHYILDNISRNSIIVLNSERDWIARGASATKPTSLFTIIIGGNIVSRGVTLDNLLGTSKNTLF